MDLLSKLYGKIVDAGIEMFSVNLSDSKYDAATVGSLDKYGIFIDYSKFNNRDDEFLAVNHEYGHCKTGCTHQLNTPYQLIGQHETRANRAAVHEFLPHDMLMKAVDKGNKEPWELADALGLPEKFVRMAVETYKIEGKLS